MVFLITGKKSVRKCHWRHPRQVLSKSS